MIQKLRKMIMYDTQIKELQSKMEYLSTPLFDTYEQLPFIWERSKQFFPKDHRKSFIFAAVLIYSPGSLLKHVKLRYGLRQEISKLTGITPTAISDIIREWVVPKFYTYSSHQALKSKHVSNVESFVFNVLKEIEEN